MSADENLSSGTGPAPSRMDGLVEEWVPVKKDKNKESILQHQVAIDQDSTFDSILTPAPVIQGSTDETMSVSLPKKGFPKAIIFALIAMLFLGALVFLATKLKHSNKGLLGKKGEIIWWGLQEEESWVRPLIEEFQKENPKVKISYMKQSTQDYRERLTNALAAGKGPDIFEIHNSWTPMFKNDLESMPASVMSTADFAKTFYPVITSDLTTSSGIVGMPLYFDAITLYVNEDILASAAKTPPEDWNELRDLAIQLTPPKNESGVIIQSGIALGETTNIDHWPEILGLMFYQSRANLSKPAGNLVEEAITFYTFFSEKAGVWDEKLPSSTIAFAQGKVAMYFGPSWRAAEIAKINLNLRFKTVPLPQLPKENPDEPDFSYATYWVESVWKRSINKDDAWNFLKFLSSRESLEKLNQETKNTQKFARPFPRPDMSLAQIKDPILGSVVALAPYAKSWYLADATYDGPTGINSQINSLFAQALISKIDVEKTLVEVEKGVAKVLSQYGIQVR